MESYLGIMHKARNHAIIPFIHRIQCLSGNGSLVILRLLVGEGAFAKPNSYSIQIYVNVRGRTNSRLQVMHELLNEILRSEVESKIQRQPKDEETHKLLNEISRSKDTLRFKSDADGKRPEFLV